MNLKSLLAGVAVAASLLGAAGAANATAIDFTGSYNPGDQIIIKFNNFESFSSSTLAPGVQNFGVLDITSIQDANTLSTIWTAGANQQIVGVFNGITISSITPTAGGFTTTNTGGVFDLYVLPASTNLGSIIGQGTGGYGAAGCAVGSLCYNGITNTGETTDVAIDLVPGIIPGDTSTTLTATTNTNTLPISGSAIGDADVVGGNDAYQFGTSFILEDDFCGAGSSKCTAPQGNWPINSQDPVTGNLAVPEPASLAIFGSALLGLGVIGNKRRKNPRA